MENKIIVMEPTDFETSVRRIIKEELEASNKNQKQPQEQTKPLSLKEAAKYLKVSETTLHLWKRKEGFPFHRINRRILFYENELREYISK